MVREIVRIGCAPRNFRPGRGGFRPKAIVIHIIVGSQKSADNSFLNPAHGTSAHFSVGRNGGIHQYVDVEDTAFHAGIVELPTWGGLERDASGRILNPNLYTLGIEHEGQPTDDWPLAMVKGSAWLVRMLADRFDIPLDRNHVIGHREIRGTKSCPGAKVDLVDLIDRAQSVAAADLPRTALSAASLAVTTRANANLRAGRPSTEAPIVRTLVRGTPLKMVSFVKDGEAVRGNRSWYCDRQGDFLWAGATDQPNP
jgi:N-acetylmuramoyl-L-alanine amidase